MKLLKFIFLWLLFSVFAISCSAPLVSSHDLMSHTNVELGLAYMQQKDKINAERVLRQAILQAPKNPEPRYVMAYFLEQSNDFSAAKKFYQQAIQLAPESGAAHNNYGAFLCRRGEYLLAENQFMLAEQAKNYLNAEIAYQNAKLCRR